MTRPAGAAAAAAAVPAADASPAGAARPGRLAAAAGRPAAAAATCALLVTLVVAVCARRAVAGTDPAGSVSAGILFAAVLAVGVALAGARGPRFWAWSGSGAWAGRRSILLGAAGAVVLCAGPLAVHLHSPGGALPGQRLPVWALVVTAVALTEEAFIRGALWDAVLGWRGEVAALAVTTVAFAVLHVPFYGPAALPLDLAVGLLLGGLRMVSGGIGAPATAHVLADLAGWWLR